MSLNIEIVSKLNVSYFSVEVRKCSTCDFAVDTIAKILENPNADHRSEHVLEKACRALSPEYQSTVSLYHSFLIDYIIFKYILVL